MPRRRIVGFALFAGGFFGLGLLVARLAGWGPPPANHPSLDVSSASVGSAPPSGPEPKVVVDAGSIVIFDGSFTIDPPKPPRVTPP